MKVTNKLIDRAIVLVGLQKKPNSTQDKVFEARIVMNYKTKSITIKTGFLKRK